VGNGVLEYNVPLASGAFLVGALSAENLASTAETKSTPAVQVKDAAAAWSARHSNAEQLRLSRRRTRAEGGRSPRAAAVEVHFSANNGLDWEPLTTITQAGEQKIDLTPQRFSAATTIGLKFVLARQKGPALDALRMTNPIQHSQRPLPRAGRRAKTRFAFRRGRRGYDHGSKGRRVASRQGPAASVHRLSSRTKKNIAGQTREPHRCLRRDHVPD